MESENQTIVALIDFLNTAYLIKHKRKPKLENYEKVRAKLQSIDSRIKVLAIADPQSINIINQKKNYESYRDKGEIVQVGPGEEADYYMIKYAEKNPNYCIISSDGFKNYNIEETLKERVIPVCIINGEVIFSKKLELFLKRFQKSNKI
ncbi:MAG: hypothetical protein ACFFDH_07340 [Promethearchaeota archaeon]